MSNQTDVIIVDDKEIATLIAHQKASQSGMAFMIAIFFILAWGMAAMFVLLYSFLHGKEPPSWAVSLESVTVTATIAMLFKDHIPSIEMPARRAKRATINKRIGLFAHSPTRSSPRKRGPSS